MDSLVHRILYTAVVYDLGDINSREGSFGFFLISHVAWLHVYKLLQNPK